MRDTKGGEKRGLDEKQALAQLRKYGENVLSSDKKVHPLKIFAGQFKDFMIMVLLASTALSVVMGETFEAITIIAIVLINALLGFIQEYRTEKTLMALKNFSPQTSKVVRDGEVKVIESAYLVPDDLVLIEAGDRIPADCRITNEFGLSCDESILTGESIAVDKTKGDMVFMGTIALRGRAEAIVTETGMKSKMGNIAGMLKEIEQEATPLQKKLDKLGKTISLICLGVCAVVMLVGVIRGENWMDMILTGISLAVAAVPEGLPAIVTICLALAVNRILKKNALIKKLHAVETLGCTNVICSDKTGTLTENKMTVRTLVTAEHSFEINGNGYDKKGDFYLRGEKIHLLDFPDAVTVMKISALCNNAILKASPNDFAQRNRRENKMKGTFELIGEPTENALLVMCAKALIDPNEIKKEYPITNEIPFDSKRKCMSVVVRDKGSICVYTKGAFDVVVDKCTSYLKNGEILPLTPAVKKELIELNDTLASQALRVIAFAFRTTPQFSEQTAETDMVFAGMCGMIDPPRKEAAAAVSKCRRAGIKPVMITGDHKLTAQAIAKELKIYTNGDRVITGRELDKMSDSQLENAVLDTSVFARVSPNHKLRIVRAFKKKNCIVAMTGDGVNDAPAIKEADIGVAMGINGTDVTKETASVVLLDDNFATIVTAVEEGRTIYSNIRKFIRYLLSCNIGEVVTMFAGMLMGFPVLLLPMHILLINLVTDSLPALALGVDPPDKNIMNLPPRRKDDTLFSGGLAGKIIMRGMLIGLTTLAVYVGFLNTGNSLEVARTAAFLTLVATQLVHVFECKSERLPLYRINIFNNLKLIGSVALSAGVVAASMYVPFLQKIFQTQPLGIAQVLAVVGASLVVPVISGLLSGIKAK